MYYWYCWMLKLSVRLQYCPDLADLIKEGRKSWESEKNTGLHSLSLFWSIISLITLKFSFTLHCLSLRSTSHHFSFPLFLSLSSSFSSVSSCNRTKSVPGGWIRSKLVARRSSLIFQFLGGTNQTSASSVFSWNSDRPPYKIAAACSSSSSSPPAPFLSPSFHRLSITAAAQPVFFWLGGKKKTSSGLWGFFRRLEMDKDILVIFFRQLKTLYLIRLNNKKKVS